MISSLFNNKKRFALVVALALTMALLVALPAMAAEETPRTDLNITTPAIGTDEINMVTAGTDVTFEAVNPGAEGVMYTFWVYGPSKWGDVAAQESDSNKFVLENVQPGAYIVDVYCRNEEGAVLAEGRQALLVDSSVTFTSEFKDGKITLTAQATNISEVEYQFWYKGSGDWTCEQDYSTANTASFAATAGQTYDVAVYAKNNNAERHWKHAAAKGDTVKAEAGGDVVMVKADVAVGSGAMSSFKTITVKPAAGIVGAAKFTVTDGATTSAAKDLGKAASYMTGADSVTVNILAADGTVLGTGTLPVNAAATDLEFAVTVEEIVVPDKKAVCTVAVGSGAMSSFKTITVVSTSGMDGAAKFAVTDGATTSAAKDIGKAASYMTGNDSVTVNILAADGSTVLGTGALSVKEAASNVTIDLQ